MNAPDFTHLLNCSRSKLFALMLTWNISTFAQERQPNNVIWGEIGLQTDLRARNGFSSALHFNLEGIPLEIGYYTNREIFAGWPFKPYRLNYIRNIRNLSLMSGLHMYTKYFSFLPMAGFSVGEGTWRTDVVETVTTNGFFPSTQKIYEYEEFRYIGAIINFKGLVTPTRWFGFDANLFVNVHQHIDYGLSVGLVFGNLRKYKE
jgi:hypothetical protein